MQKAKRILASLVVLLMTGCAAKSVQRDYALDEKSGKGIVILSVSHDQRGSRALNATFYVDFKPGLIMPEHMMLKTLGETVPGITKGSEFKDVYGQVLALELPAGPHQINSWRAARSGGFEITPRDMPPPLEFEVVAGKVQYLGNLHLILAGGKNIFGIPSVFDAPPEVRY